LCYPLSAFVAIGLCLFWAVEHVQYFIVYLVVFLYSEYHSMTEKLLIGEACVGMRMGVGICRPCGDTGQ